MNSTQVTTPKGRICKERESEMISLLSQKFPPYKFVTFEENNHFSAVDGICLTNDSRIYSIFEIKSRKGIFDTEKMLFKVDDLKISTARIDFDKLMTIQSMSEAFRVPAILYNYFYECNVIVSIKLTDSKGLILPKFWTRIAETQFGVTGGKKKVLLAHIPIEQGKVIYS